MLILFTAVERLTGPNPKWREVRAAKFCARRCKSSQQVTARAAAERSRKVSPVSQGGEYIKSFPK